MTPRLAVAYRINFSKSNDEIRKSFFSPKPNTCVKLKFTVPLNTLDFDLNTIRILRSPKAATHNKHWKDNNAAIINSTLRVVSNLYFGVGFIIVVPILLLWLGLSDVWGTLGHRRILIFAKYIYSQQGGSKVSLTIDLCTQIQPLCFNDMDSTGQYISFSFWRKTFGIK